MKPRRQPLKRTPLGRGKALERKTRLRNGPVKPRRDVKNSSGESTANCSARKTRGPVKARSESTHIPEPIRLAVYARDSWTCQRCGIYIPDNCRTWGLQHRRPRQAGGSKLLHTMANLVLLCGWTTDPGLCTEAVELLDRTTATAEGWLLPRRFRRIAPEQWPVLRWDGQWAQPGDGWTACQPHPRQLELLGEAA